MPTVMITPEAMREVPAPYVEVLEAAGFTVRYPENPQFARGGLPLEETVAQLQGVHATLASGERYDAELLSRLPELRVIARVGVGYDQVDVAAATQRGIAVTITPTANHEAVAELALGLLFGVTKRLVANDALVRAGKWSRESLIPIRGKTIGIVGLGRIGRSMAVRCQALGMRVLVYELYPDPAFVQQHGLTLVDFPELLASSDFVSVHCPLNDQTRGMFNRDAFAQMKDDAIFINTARGGLVVERDLVAALEQGTLGGAGLDVFEVEPPPAGHPLFQRPDVVLSPHLAGCDEKSLTDMGVEAAQCIVKLHRGEWPEGAVVNQQLQSSWNW